MEQIRNPLHCENKSVGPPCGRPHRTSRDADASNATVNGGGPEAGPIAKLAVGGWFGVVESSHDENKQSENKPAKRGSNPDVHFTYRLKPSVRSRRQSTSKGCVAPIP